MSGMRRTLGTRCPPCRTSWLHMPLAAACASVSCSHLGRLPDKGSFCQSSGQEATGEACKAVPEGARQPCAEPVEDAASVMSPLASPAPPTERLLPLASALSQSPTTSSISIHSHSSLSGSQPPEPFFPLDDLSPQPLALSPSTSCLHDSEAHFPPPTASSAPPLSDSTMTPPQCDLMALPLRTIPQSSSPHTPLSASPVAVPAISGLDYSSCSILTPSQWQAAAKALCLSNSSQCKSQQEHLSHHSQEALLRRDSTDRMVEAVSPSLLESDDQNLLEIQVTERIKIKISKEKGKDRLYPKQMSPDYHLNSLGKMLPSLGAEQDTTIPQPFWTAKDKPEQLPSPQQLSYPKVLGDHLQQKYNQLFWGLSSLHSESPVATAWISENSSTLQSPSFLFNGISNACPIHLQAKLPPLLSHSQPLPQLEFQPQALIPRMLQLQAPPLAQAQAHFQSPVQILGPSSPSQIRACGVSCPTARNELKSLTSIEIQNTEWPLLPKQLESGWAPPSVIERSQEVFNIFTPNLPEDSWVGSILPENIPISPELRKQLEQHLQKWLIQNRWELPRKIQESLELRQLQSELPGKCPVKDKHGASRPSSFTGESSKDPQKVGFQLKQDMSKVPKNLSRSSERPIVAFQEVDSEGSENDWMLLRKDLTSGLPRSLDKNLENIPKGHLGRNWGQTSEGLIPVSVRRSWLAVNHASPKSNAHMETRNLGILKGWEPWVNTSHRVSFLDTNTQKMLEAHMTKFWVRHMWGLPLKLIKSINHFTLKKVQPSPTLQFAFRPSAPCVPGDHSIVQLAEVLGKLPQPHLGEKAIGEESVPTLERTLLAPLPVCEEIQRALGQIPLGDDHGTTKASLARQEGRSPPQAITLTWQSGIVEWAMKDSTEPSPGSTMSRNEPGGKSGLHASRDPSHQVTVPEMNIGPQSLRAKEAREAGKATLSPAFQPESRDILGTNVLTKSQNKNAHLGSLEAPGTSKSPLYPRMTVLQDPGEPRLNTEMVSEFKSNVKVQSENLPHECPRHKPLATDNLASQVPQCHPQGVPNGNKLVFQMLCGLKAASSSSPEQQEPRTKRYQGFWKNQSEMFVPTYEREDCRWPNPGEHAEKLEKLGTCQDRSMSSSAQARKTVGSVGKKYLQLLPEKKQSVLQSFFKRKMRIFPHKKFQGQDALQKCKPKSATAQSQQSVKSRSILDSENVEAQELMTAVGQILEKKMAIHHGLHATKLKEHKREHPAPVCVCVCCLPYSTEQARMMNYTPHSQQADSKDQNCSTREKQVRPEKSLKSVRFDDEQLEVSRNPSLAPKKTLSPVSACQYRPRMPCTPGHQPHCPRHYLFRGRVLPGPCFTNLF